MAGIMVDKYEGGTKEHEGNLWDVPDMNGHALEEVADLANYLLTQRNQIAQFGQTLDILVEGEKDERVKGILDLLQQKFKVLRGK